MSRDRAEPTRRTVLALSASLGLASTAGCVEQLTDQFTSPSVAEVKKNAERIPYQDLYRNISEYEGEFAYYPNLYISDVVSGQDTKEYLLAFNSGGINDDRVLYGIWNGDPFKRNDDVEVWGVVGGLETYTSLVGDQTVPKIRIKAMERR